MALAAHPYTFFQHALAAKGVCLGVPAPTANTPTDGGAGSLTAATYYYVVTATNGNGETVASNEVSRVTAASHQNVVTWKYVPGATGYRVYRTTSSGVYPASSLAGTVGSPFTLTFTDNVTSLTTGTPPAANTTPDPFGVLLLSAYTPSQANHRTVADVLAAGTETTGGGYTRQTLTGMTVSDSGLATTWTAANPAWSTTQVTGWAAYAVWYVNLAGSADASRIVGTYWDFGGANNAPNGIFTLAVDTSGLLTLTVS